MQKSNIHKKLIIVTHDLWYFLNNSKIENKLSSIDATIKKLIGYEKLMIRETKKREVISKALKKLR
jgi:hypothetical protein